RASSGKQQTGVTNKNYINRLRNCRLCLLFVLLPFVNSFSGPAISPVVPFRFCSLFNLDTVNTSFPRLHRPRIRRFLLIRSHIVHSVHSLHSPLCTHTQPLIHAVRSDPFKKRRLPPTTSPFSNCTLYHQLAPIQP
ncbi:hypothetical protein EDD21DRAFT_445802, partial [Dissophora ornata]